MSIQLTVFFLLLSVSLLLHSPPLSLPLSLSPSLSLPLPLALRCYVNAEMVSHSNLPIKNICQTILTCSADDFGICQWAKFSFVIVCFCARVCW